MKQREVPASQLIQSVHNTSRHNTKVFLTQASKFEEAMDQFSNLHNILKNNIKQQFHANVFIPGTIPGLAGHKADSISCCNYSPYASVLLSNFNPQEGDGSAVSTASAPKRVKPASITYTKASTSTPSQQP
jgi:hypothetical protein